MSKGKSYRSRITVEIQKELTSDGDRVYLARISGDKKLFDATALLEEKGAVEALEERIKRAIKDEIVSAMRELDEFFSLVRSRAKQHMKMQCETDETF
jgi:hypothetical protein